VTSYLRRWFAVSLDYSPFDRYEPLTSWGDLEQTVFSHETRVSSTDPAAVLGWVAGIWYSDSRIREQSAAEEDWTARSTVTDQTQLAGFGQLSLRLNKRLTKVGSS